MKTYTIDQFRKYLETQDSRGDIFYNLSEENIDAANSEEVNDNVEVEGNLTSSDYKTTDSDEGWRPESNRNKDYYDEELD